MKIQLVGLGNVRKSPRRLEEKLMCQFLKSACSPKEVSKQQEENAKKKEGFREFARFLPGLVFSISNPLFRRSDSWV
jgi:hypothetical protein